MASDIFGYSIWNLLHATFLAPRILMWLLKSWKICALLVYRHQKFRLRVVLVNNFVNNVNVETNFVSNYKQIIIVTVDNFVMCHQTLLYS